MDERISHTIIACALQFDGQAYLDSQGRDEGHWRTLVDHAVRDLAFQENDADNWAIFYLLQRSLHKWGGETLPDDCREWRCYYLLFLHLYRSELPSRFLSRERVSAWAKYSRQELERCAATIRNHLSTTSELICDEDLQYYDLESYLFRVVNPRFHQYSQLSAFDLFSIIIWKANRAKTKIAKRLLKKHPTLDDAAAALCRDLLNAPDDEGRLRTLMDGWGFLLPMASAILTIFWPESFTVYDIRVCDQLNEFHNLGSKSPAKVWKGYASYRVAVSAAVPQALSLRDKDRVLWSRNSRAQLREDVRRGFA